VSPVRGAGRAGRRVLSGPVSAAKVAAVVASAAIAAIVDAIPVIGGGVAASGPVR
jgi:hypothetical protein